MAEAYAERRVVDVKGFMAGLAEKSVTFASPYDKVGAAPAQLLGSLIYGRVDDVSRKPDAPMSRDMVLPTLVWALGQERFRRNNPPGGPRSADPSWGDGYLDPLQFALLTASIFSKPAAADVTQTSSVSGLSTIKSFAGAEGFIADFFLDKAEGEFTGGVQDLVEVPLDKEDAAKVSVCGSLILYGHKVSMTNTPR